jgi:hypothetical protein
MLKDFPYNYFIYICRKKIIVANVIWLYAGGEIDAHLVSLAQMTNSSTNFQLRNAAPLLYSICWQQYFLKLCKN